MMGEGGRRLECVLVVGILAATAAMLAVGARPAAAAPRLMVRPQPLLRPQQLTVQRVPLERLNGVVVPQGLRRMTLAARPKLEVWNGQGGEFNFYGPDAFIDWRRADLKWWFRWSDAGAGAKAVWQVCRFEPTVTTKHWKEPPGLVASGELGELPARGKTAGFSIDFAGFAPKQPGSGPLRAVPQAGARMTSTPGLTVRGTTESPARVLRGPVTIRPVQPAPQAVGRAVQAAGRGLSVESLQMAQPAYVGLQAGRQPVDLLRARRGAGREGRADRRHLLDRHGEVTASRRPAT